VNQLHLCSNRASLRDVRHTCLGALWHKELKQAMQLCSVSFAPRSEVLVPLDNSRVAVDPAFNEAKIYCKDKGHDQPTSLKSQVVMELGKHCKVVIGNLEYSAIEHIAPIQVQVQIAFNVSLAAMWEEILPAGHGEVLTQMFGTYREVSLNEVHSFRAAASNTSSLVLGVVIAGVIICLAAVAAIVFHVVGCVRFARVKKGPVGAPASEES
jgi:hypothetical protein